MLAYFIGGAAQWDGPWGGKDAKLLHGRVAVTELGLQNPESSSCRRGVSDLSAAHFLLSLSVFSVFGCHSGA